MRREPTRAAGSRLTLSIIGVFGLASFRLPFAAFWSGAFRRFEVFTSAAVAVLVFIAVNGAAWACWGTALPWAPSVPGSPASAPDLSVRSAVEEGSP